MCIFAEIIENILEMLRKKGCALWVLLVTGDVRRTHGE